MSGDENERRVTAALRMIGTGRPDKSPVPDAYLRERAERERADVRAWAEQRSERRRANSFECIPAAFAWASFGAPELVARCGGEDTVQTARESVGRLLCRGITSVVLTGQSGAGKTSLAAAMARAAIDRWTPGVWWVDAYSLARAYRDARMGAEPEIIAKAKRASLLVLDDMGSEAQGRDVLRELLHERHAEGRPTIVTTWMGMGEIREAYGDGTARRLFERGLLIEIGGEQ